MPQTRAAVPLMAKGGSPCAINETAALVLNLKNLAIVESCN